MAGSIDVLSVRSILYLTPLSVKHDNHIYLSISSKLIHSAVFRWIVGFWDDSEEVLLKILRGEGEDLLYQDIEALKIKKKNVWNIFQNILREIKRYMWYSFNDDLGWNFRSHHTPDIILLTNAAAGKSGQERENEFYLLLKTWSFLCGSVEYG